MTTSTANPETTSVTGPAFRLDLPVHHLGVAPINQLARKFGDSRNKQALAEERSLMSATGADLPALRARARGVTAYVRRMFERRRTLLRSTEWAKVQKLITSTRLSEALDAIPDLPDAQYFINLSDALRKGEAFRRDVRLAALADRLEELVANPEWEDASDRVRNPKHADLLKEGIREHAGEGYVKLALAAVNSGEKALAAHIRSHTDFGSGGHTVSTKTARQRAAQLRKKQARSAAAHTKGGTQSKNKAA